MNEDDNIIIIPLTNIQLDFYPKRNYLYFVTFASVFMFFPFLLKNFLERNLILFASSSLMFTFSVSLIIFFEGIRSKRGDSLAFFEQKIDSFNKTKEDKIREFWGNVLNDPKKKIKSITTEIEDYEKNGAKPQNQMRSFVTKMTLSGLVLFERNNEGYVSHLEGMPSILFLRD